MCLVLFCALYLFFQSKYGHKLKNKLFLSLLPLSFGLDFLLSRVRFSILGDESYLGLALDTFRFLGVSFSKNFNLGFINQDFEGYQLNAFLKFDYEKIWQNNGIALIAFPLIHILMAFVLFLVLRKLSPKARAISLLILFLLWTGYIFQVATSDPRIVLPYP